EKEKAAEEESRRAAAAAELLRKQEAAKQREAEEKEKAAEEESRRAAANAELLRKQEAAKQIEAEERRAELKGLANFKEQQDSSDAEVLKKLAMALGKDLKWLQNGGGEDVYGNKWKGVKWDAKNERVVTIDWARQGLKGELLPIIGQLTSLQTLNLRCNWNLTGSIPRTIGNCTQLYHFIASYTKLSGGCCGLLCCLKWPICVRRPSNLQL
ncbi:hypothetical protein ScalyP_jg9482, partial [Parmales sp. scaly parma]